MAEDEEDISPEEKIQIAQHYLLNSPPGQFGAVLEDVQVLVGKDLITSEKLASIARDYNSKNLRVLRSGEHPPLVVSKLAEVGGDTTKYLEPATKMVYTVDHATLTLAPGSTPEPCGATGSPLGEGSDEDFRVALEGAVGEYTADRFVDGTAACAAYATQPGTLVAVISGEKLNLRNFWSGQFMSTWTVVLDSAGPTVTGEIKIRAHYFESGNVQLQTKKIVSATTLAVKGGDAASVAAAVKEHVAVSEKEVMEGLEEMYANMTDDTFKAMRRVMPVHRNKMNWNIHEVKLNTTLRK